MYRAAAANMSANMSKFLAANPSSPSILYLVIWIARIHVLQANQSPPIRDERRLDRRGIYERKDLGRLDS